MSNNAGLPLFHAVAGREVLVLGEGVAAEAKRRLVERAGAVVTDDFARAVDEGVRLAFIAYEDASACAVAAINARCAGMLVNVVDRPELCDFTTPAIIDRAPLLVAVGTGGASAGLAKHVRLRLERLLPGSLGELAQALAAARPLLRARWPDPRARRAALDAALREGGMIDPFDPGAWQRVTEWAAAADRADAQSGTPRPASRGSTRYTFTLISRDPEDLTLRQARLLGEADLLLLDGAVPAAILARARADAARRAWTEADGQHGAGEANHADGADEPDAANRPQIQDPSQLQPEAVAPFSPLTLVLRWRPRAAP